MGLNIKNERVCGLAREAAAATGLTQTSVIEMALQQLLAENQLRVTAAEKVERARATLVDMQRRWTATSSEQPFTESDLYDESGLPA